MPHFEYILWFGKDKLANKFDLKSHTTPKNRTDHLNTLFVNVTKPLAYDCFWCLKQGPEQG